MLHCQRNAALSGALLAVILLAGSAGDAFSACATIVVGTWKVQLNTGMSYDTVIRADGTLQSQCVGCEKQTWTCTGRTFTVRGPGSVVVEHAIEASGRVMRSSVSTVSRPGGAPAVVKPGPPTCSPRATVAARSESVGAYEVVLVDNDCPHRVKFQYASAPVVGNLPERTHWTACAPANRTGQVVARSSSTSLARLRVGQTHARC